MCLNFFTQQDLINLELMSTPSSSKRRTTSISPLIISHKDQNGDYVGKLQNGILSQEPVTGSPKTSDDALTLLLFLPFRSFPPSWTPMLPHHWNSPLFPLWAPPHILPPPPPQHPPRLLSLPHGLLPEHSSVNQLVPAGRVGWLPQVSMYRPPGCREDDILQALCFWNSFKRPLTHRKPFSLASWNFSKLRYIICWIFKAFCLCLQVDSGRHESSGISGYLSLVLLGTCVFVFVIIVFVW